MLRRLELTLAACLYYSGIVKLARWWTRRQGQRLVVLCYHRAAGGSLRQHLLYLRRHYRILHLEAALEGLYQPRKDVLQTSIATGIPEGRWPASPLPSDQQAGQGTASIPEGRWPASPLPSDQLADQGTEGRGDAGHRPSGTLACHRLVEMLACHRPSGMPACHRPGGMLADHRPVGMLALTFDDGYYDNYTEAFALASELQVPITLFLVPGYIESGRRFWWYEPRYLLCHAQTCEATVEGRTYHLGSAGERRALEQAIEERLRNASSINEREAFLAAVREELLVPSPVEVEEQPALPLTWEHVREMENSGWVSFDAHTMHHPTLACLADPCELHYEVSECRMVLEQRLGHSVRAFAYPIGKGEHIGEPGIAAVRAAQYDWALTTIHGINTPRTDPHLLHRIVVDVDQHWLMVAAKSSGAWDFCLRLFRKKSVVSF